MADIPQFISVINKALNQGYEGIDEIPLMASEALKIEAVMMAGNRMKNAEGLVAPFRIPPAVALAIVRALSSAGEMAEVITAAESLAASEGPNHG